MSKASPAAYTDLRVANATLDGAEDRAEAAEASAEKLRGALRAMLDWFAGREGEDATDIFERIADDFYRDRHMLRPGKSQPLEMSGYPSDEARREAFDAWCKVRHDEVVGAARAALSGTAVAAPKVEDTEQVAAPGASGKEGADV